MLLENSEEFEDESVPPDGVNGKSLRVDTCCLCTCIDSYLEDNDESSELKTAAAAEDLSTLTTAQLFARREQKLKEKKDLIGLAASKLVEDPESNVSNITNNSAHVLSLQVSLLKTLRSLCEEREPEVCITVRKLAMVSTMAVFKDIVPG